MHLGLGAFPDEMNGVDIAPVLEGFRNLFDPVPSRIQKNHFRGRIDPVHKHLVIFNPRIDEDHFFPIRRG